MSSNQFVSDMVIDEGVEKVAAVVPEALQSGRDFAMPLMSSDFLQCPMLVSMPNVLSLEHMRVDVSVPEEVGDTLELFIDEDSWQGVGDNMGICLKCWICQTAL